MRGSTFIWSKGCYQYEILVLVSVEFRGAKFGFGGGVDCAYGAYFGFENVVIRMAKMRCPDIKFLETDRACFAD